MLVVFELEEIESGDQAVGRVAGYNVEIAGLERAIGEREVHFAWLACKTEAISFRKSRITVGPRHEILSETRLPIFGERYGVGDSFQIVFPGDLTTNEDRE